MLYLRSKSAGGGGWWGHGQETDKRNTFFEIHFMKYILKGGGWWGHGQETIDAARREGTVEN